MPYFMARVVEEIERAVSEVVKNLKLTNFEVGIKEFHGVRDHFSVLA
jgi:hypothetical protein